MTSEAVLRLLAARSQYCWEGSVLHRPRTGFELVVFDQHHISAPS